MIQNIYPLSPLQEGIYYHWLSFPESRAYFIQMSYQLQGKLEIDILEKSYAMLVERHDILRTFFTQDFGESALQVVRKEVSPGFVYLDLSGKGKESIISYKNEEKANGFNLHTGSQMRLSVLKLDDDRHEFIWSHHHIIMDGWCLSLLISDFFQIYYCLVQGNIPELKTVYPYSNYIEWLMRVDKQNSLRYWGDYLSGYDTARGLPKLQVTEKQEYLGEEMIFQLEKSVRQSISKFCMQSGITENIFFQTAWGILLSKYNDTNDVVFGSIVSGRPGEVRGVEEMIGLFINTIPVRIQFEGKENVSGIFKQVQEKFIDGLGHHYSQLAEVLAQNILGKRLFDHLLQFQNLPVHEAIEQEIKATNNSEKFKLLSSDFSGDNTTDFTCIIIPGNSIVLKYKYNRNLYDPALINQFQAHFVTLIKQILANPLQSVDNLDYISQEEKKQLLSTGHSVVDYPGHKTIINLFEEQVGRTPDNIALVFNKKELTYRELNERADRLANYLRINCGVKADDLVGIILDRSEYMIIAILGIMKSGGAYVAIDPEYPKARKELIINDTGIKALITETEYVFDLEFYSGNVLAIDIQLDGLDQLTDSLVPINQPADLAYVVYTSGSTGQPKGVMINHQSVVDYFYGILEKTNIKDCKSFGLVSTIAADLGNTVIYTSLLTGGCLHVFSASDVIDADRMGEASIDCLKIVPSHWKALQKDNKLFAPDKCLVFGGEQLTKDIIDLVKAKKGNCNVYNHYGPSETTIGKLIRQIDLNSPDVTISLGRPFCNTSIYIIGVHGELLPPGITGEICISGDGLARGYLNKPELTAEKFVPAPFRQGERMYKTGDLGRWLQDGTIEFMGRKDDQVKIHGYRIELGEIENALRNHPTIDSAIVLAKLNASGDKELIAYIVCKEPFNKQEIQSYLNEILPTYMVPNYFMQLGEIPLTANGKVDKKKLPDPVGSDRGTQVEYVAPRNEIEEKLVLIWQEILGKEKIGVKDDFLAIGGHSLKAVQLISRISTTFLVRVDIQVIFKEATVENISEQIIFILDQNKQKKYTDELVSVEV